MQQSLGKMVNTILNTKNLCSRVNAFTLIEVIVALFISSLLLLICNALLVSHSLNRQEWENFQTWRYQITLIAHLLREAEANTPIAALCVPGSQFKIDSHIFPLSVRSLSAVSADNLPKTWQRRLAKDSDVLMFETMQSLGMGRILLTNKRVLTVDEKLSAKVGDKWLISDCEKGSTVIITQIEKMQNKQYVTLNMPLVFAVNRDVQIHQYQHIFFFVANTHRKVAANTISALYSWDQLSPAQEIAENIASIGIKEVAPALQRIEVLMKSARAFLVTPQVYYFRDKEKQAQDHYAYFVLRILL